MIISSYNCFDNSNPKSTVPFKGNYEDVSKYGGIFIYVTTETDDSLYVEFTNTYSSNMNDTNNYDSQTLYNISNSEKTFKIYPKMKYFRIKITSTETYDSGDIKKYNVF